MAKKTGLGISVQDKGIATVLNHTELMVPPNQRSYAWEDSHIATLFEDFSYAISEGSEAYFLGTIVLTQGTEDRLEVADGQQRLATTTILIAAIRDYLATEGEDAGKKAANKYTTDYLLQYDEMSGENIPKLQLNYEDNDYFIKRILLLPEDPERKKIKANTLSHARLNRAAEIARDHVEKIVSQFSSGERAKRLYEWVQFLKENALVIEIRVPEDINAFTMFETLNDRGLKASQTDILKNALFALAQDKISEVQVRWGSMTTSIDTFGDSDLLLTYLRHYWSTQYGYVVERELAEKIKKKIATKQQAVNFIIELEKYAADYIGLLTPLEYVGWPKLDSKTRAYIYILTHILKIEQVRPLLLAIVTCFEVEEAQKALKMLLSWSVRFLVAGSGGGGPLDRAYMSAANAVMDGIVKTAKQLFEVPSMQVLKRSDKEFKEAFSKVRATKNNIARYYLRALESYRENEASPGVMPEPELGGILDNKGTFNLEHVMPQSDSDEWDVDPEILQQYRKRLGNMALLNPGENAKLGNGSFAEKKEVYKKSPIFLTEAISEYDDWGAHQIEDRQAKLSELAVKIWDQ